MVRTKKDLGREKTYLRKSEESRKENPSYVKISTDLGVESVLRGDIDTDYRLRCLSTGEKIKSVRIHISRLDWYEEFGLDDGRTCLRLKYGYEEMIEGAKKDVYKEEKEENPKKKTPPSRTIGDFWGK